MAIFDNSWQVLWTIVWQSDVFTSKLPFPLDHHRRKMSGWERLNFNFEILQYLYHRFISEQAKYPKRLSLSVSKSVWLTPRKPSNANLSRPSTCKLVWRTTIPKRTSVSLALLSTSIYPIWLGESMLHRRTLTQGLKNWGDEGTRWSILFLIGYAMFQGPSSLSASSEISNIVTKPRLKDFPIWALMTWKSWTNRRNWWRS